VPEIWPALLWMAHKLVNLRMAHRCRYVVHRVTHRTSALASKPLPMRPESVILRLIYYGGQYIVV
jgi:hypothetical protein